MPDPEDLVTYGDLASTDPGKGADLVASAYGFLAEWMTSREAVEIFVTSYGIEPLAANDGTDQTTALVALWGELSAGHAVDGLVRTLVYPPGRYNVDTGTEVPDGIVHKAAGWIPKIRHNQAVRFSPCTGASAGTLLTMESGCIAWGFLGFNFVGSESAGFHALDWGAAQYGLISGNQFNHWGGRAMKSTGAHLNLIEHNVCLNCRMDRTLTEENGVVELHETDSAIYRNEWGCSATREGTGSAPLYGANPYYAAAIIQGGRNWIDHNFFELSEIGCISYTWHSTFGRNRYEFNKACGLVERGGGNLHDPWDVDANSKAGSGLYAHVLVDQQSNWPPNTFGPCLQLNTVPGGGWVFSTTQLATIEDITFDSHPTWWPTRYLMGPFSPGHAITVKSSDPRIRGPQMGLRTEVTRGENGCRNTALAGALVGTIGSGGALPTGWAWSGASNIAIEVVSLFADGPFDVIRLKLTCGSAPSPNYGLLLFANWDQYAIPALAAEKWTASVFLRHYDQTVPPGSSTIQVREVDADGGNNINIGSGSVLRITSPFDPIDQCRHSHTRTVTESGTRRVIPDLELGFGSNTSLNVTYDIAVPMIERANTLGAPMAAPLDGPLYTKGHEKVNATNGGSTTAAPRTGHLILANSGTIASHSVTLPTMAHGDVFVLTNVGQVTALTLVVQHGTFAATAPTTMAAGSRFAWRFDASDQKFYAA